MEFRTALVRFAEDFKVPVRAKSAASLFDTANPQPSPQNSMSFDTVEVRSSSLLVPTISFNNLASLIPVREAPNGSISNPKRGGEVVSTLPRTRLLARSNFRLALLIGH